MLNYKNLMPYMFHMGINQPKGLMMELYHSLHLNHSKIILIFMKCVKKMKILKDLIILNQFPYNFGISIFQKLLMYNGMDCSALLDRR